MKKLHTLVAAIVALAGAAPLAAQGSGPVGYWKGDDAGHPGVATDASGLGHDGVYKDGAAPTAEHEGFRFPNTGSMGFDGSAAYVDVPQFTWAGGGPVTVSFWNYAADPTERPKMSPAFSVGNRTDFEQFAVFAPDEGGDIRWNYGTALKAYYLPYRGAWTHVVLVSEGRDGHFAAIYLNGAMVASADTSSGPDSLGGLTIGRGVSYQGTNYHKGMVDDFRIYDRVLSEEEIGMLWNENAGFGPLLPSQLEQKNSSPASPLSAGGISTGEDVLLSAKVSDPDWEYCAIDVEVRLLDDPFTDRPTVYGTSYVKRGLRASVLLPGLQAHRAYHWQVLARNQSGQQSGWSAFGQAPEDPRFGDFMVGPNAPPAAASPAQVRVRDGRAIDPSEKIDDRDVVRFLAEVSDDELDPVQLQVELRRAGEAFSGEPTVSADWSASGNVASCVSAVKSGTYHWQYRTLDALGAESAWTPFRAGSDGDFVVETQGSAGKGLPSVCVGAGSGGLPWLLVLWIPVVLAQFLRSSRPPIL